MDRGLPAPGFNLPYGVSPNDPHLTGEWPIEDLVDSWVEQLNVVYKTVEEIGLEIEDSGAYITAVAEAHSNVIEYLAAFKNEVLNLIPEEPVD